MSDHLDGLRMLEEALSRARGNTRPDVRTARRACEANGHQYQVHGKANPAKVTCKRCRVSWAIGPRTEPAE